MHFNYKQLCFIALRRRMCFDDASRNHNNRTDPCPMADKRLKPPRPTMDDIARIAQVSKPTVSRALSGSPLVSEKKREIIMQIAREQGYAVNRNAQKLRQARTNTVAVMLDFGSHRHGAIGDPFIYELLAGISEALSVRDVDLLLSPPGLETTADYIDFYRSRGTDGFIILGQGMREPMLRDLARRSVPIIVWGAVMPESGYCAIGSDNFAGGQLAGERFAARGCRKWLFVGNTDHDEIRLRYAGLSDAAKQADDIEVDLLRIDVMAFADTHDRAVEYLRGGKRPDAVFAFSDTAAMAVVSAFREEGLTTPRDFALVGYNNIPPTAHFSPSISTIEQDTSIAGHLLVEKLMQLIDGGKAKSAILPTRLISRET